jgi:hypothetical protein
MVFPRDLKQECIRANNKIPGSTTWSAAKHTDRDKRYQTALYLQVTLETPPDVASHFSQAFPTSSYKISRINDGDNILLLQVIHVLTTTAPECK